MVGRLTLNRAAGEKIRENRQTNKKDVRHTEISHMDDGRSVVGWVRRVPFVPHSRCVSICLSVSVVCVRCAALSTDHRIRHNNRQMRGRRRGEQSG